MRILFSEHEEYYRDLGLKNVPNISYVFNGSRFYKKNDCFLKRFDLFVCAFYTMPHNVMLTIKFKGINKPSVIVSDGIFDFSNALENPMLKKYNVIMYHPIVQDYLICVGSKEAAYFSNRVTSFNYLPTRVLSKTNMIPLPSKNKVLITTANTAYFNQIEFNALLVLISGVIDCLVELSVDFSLRIYDEVLLESINESFSGTLNNDISTSFESCLESYSNIVTTPSSIAITSMYHKRAVALLIYRDNPMFLQSGWLIPTRKVFESSLDSFLDLDAKRLDIQHNILKTYLSENGITELLFNLGGAVPSSDNDRSSHINISYFNMLNSKFNFNIEWLVRKVYLRFKNIQLLKKIRLKIK